MAGNSSWVRTLWRWTPWSSSCWWTSEDFKAMFVTSWVSGFLLSHPGQFPGIHSLPVPSGSSGDSISVDMLSEEVPIQHPLHLHLHLLLPPGVWPAVVRPRVLANQFQATVQMSAPSCPTVDWATHWWLRQSLSHSPLLWTEAEALGWARFPVSWSRPGPWWRQARGRTPPPSTAPSSLPPRAAAKKPTSQTFGSRDIVFSFALNCN